MRSRILLSMFIAAVVLAIGVNAANAQPSAAQVKKDVSGPKTVSVTVLGRGTRVWSKGYSKYVWDVPYTAKVKSEEPGVNILVEATASYDIAGGRYVYWKSFVGSNLFEGIPNPTEAEVAALLQRFGPQPIMMGEFYSAVKIEGIKLADKPRFEWHNLNSVSFTVYATFTEQVNYTTTRRIAKPYRARLYRDGKTMPWKSIGQSDNPNDDEVIIVL
ncbi:MAG: hypothetical protein IPO41_07520 [Acidobacteria bacterium]|nr:hypothetical protein [Acidobacteriota bacterium]MBP7476310.1 hypothetical protein [Pyrinomonadaceae bacterium]MBP9108391.1 hypothetical protein [Pyrinomonadaceae bacterium]